jgi:CubicO group peptidase (beta-lactamase class C family)
MSSVRDMDALLKRFVDEGLSGCGCKVMQRGNTLYEGYFGMADKEAGTPVDKRSVFRMASMSKIPMYTVCMMLYEAGVYNLTDPVSDYLPEWKDLKKYVKMPNGDLKVVPCEKQLTVGDIFSMKCGLPYCNGPMPTNDPTLASMQECMKPLWERGYYTNAEQVAATSKAILACEPGEKWIYGFSSEISVALIEKVTGKGIDTVMKEMLFDPLEMNDTRSRFFGDIESRMVKNYMVGDNNTPHFDPRKLDEKHIPGPEHEQGWARLFSTVEDYSHLMQMLAEGGMYKGKKIIGRRTIDMMRSNGLSSEQLKGYTSMYEAGYGYGYGVRTLIDRQAGNHPGSLGSFGWTGGFGTWCEADPQDGVSIVYMHNQIPNMEEYYHHLVRQVAYGLAD